MTTVAQRHLAAIKSGRVTKTNVIGIRKALAHVDRLRRGWPGNRSNATPAEADEIEEALRLCEPNVVGDLFLSGLDILEKRRWQNRFTGNERDIIEDLDTIKLVRFDRVGERMPALVPIYRAVGRSGDSFLYRNIPWQTAYYMEPRKAGGPEVVEGIQ